MLLSNIIIIKESVTVSLVLCFQTVLQELLPKYAKFNLSLSKIKSITR